MSLLPKVSQELPIVVGQDVPKRDGGAPWNPKQQTLAVVEDAKRVIEEYKAMLPLPIRQIFYILDKMGYPKTEKFYKNQLCEYLNRARRAGMIPWDAIVDEGAVWLEPTNVYDDLTDFGRHVTYWSQRYRKDLLYNQDVRVRVHTEAAGLAPQIRRTADRYTIPVTSGGGSDSVDIRHRLSELAVETFETEGRRTIFLLFGDYDPTGESIFEVFAEDIATFVSHAHDDPEQVVEFRRVMLTREQAVRHQLPTKPPKESDSRTKNWPGTDTTQLEAAAPDLHRDYHIRSIESVLNMDAFEEAKEVEAEEQRVLRENPSKWSRQGGAT